MVKISGVKIDGQEQALFNKLETTTFERAYREKYIDIKPTTFVEKCQRCWAQVWLHTFGRDGWKAGNIDGVDTLKAERAAIKEYRTQRDNLITQLAKTPIKNVNIAQLLEGEAESLTSKDDPKNERLRQSQDTEDAIPAFYKALSARVSFIETASVDQAQLRRAGFAQVSAKIAEHNQVKGLAFISPKWIMPVEAISKDTARTGLAASISVEDLSTKGTGAIAEALDLYIKTFGLTDEEDVTTLAEEVYNKVVELHGKKCQSELEIRQHDDYVEAETEHLEIELNNKLADAQNKMMDFLAINTGNNTKNRIRKAKTQLKSKNREALKNSFDSLRKNQKTQRTLKENIANITKQLANCKESTEARVEQEIENLKYFTPKYSIGGVVVLQIVKRLELDKASEDTVPAEEQPKKRVSGGVKVMFDQDDFNFTDGLEPHITDEDLVNIVRANRQRQKELHGRRKNQYHFSVPTYNPASTGASQHYTFTSAAQPDPVVNLEDDFSFSSPDDLRDNVHSAVF